MSRYIDADKAMEEINRIGGHNLCEWETIGVKALIYRQPTADVVEVRHGYWVRNEDHNAYECEHFCSVCLADGSYDVSHEKYCYNCGAKMDGERSNK